MEIVDVVLKILVKGRLLSKLQLHFHKFANHVREHQRVAGHFERAFNGNLQNAEVKIFNPRQWAPWAKEMEVRGNAVVSRCMCASVEDGCAGSAVRSKLVPAVLRNRETVEVQIT